jgi:hypothetical protein
MMSLRLNAIALLISTAAPLIGPAAIAEPLDKESCAGLQNQRKQLFNADMQAALEQGPDWVKKHLTDEAIERVRRFLSVEEQIQFRCRGGGVDKPVAKPTDAKPTDAKATDAKATDAKATDAKATDAKATDAKATDAKATDAKATDAKATDAKATDGTATDATTVPLPDRKPTPPSKADANGNPSQALADSDKTPPGKPKATR